MKKLVFLLMLLLNITVFAEKLNTDGKNNLDKMQGLWESSMIKIIKKNNKWYGIDVYPTSDEKPYEIKQLKNGVLVIPFKDDDGNIRNYYFGYDIKYKTKVEVDKNGNIKKKEQRRVECLHNNTCG